MKRTLEKYIRGMTGGSLHRPRNLYSYCIVVFLYMLTLLPSSDLHDNRVAIVNNYRVMVVLIHVEGMSGVSHDKLFLQQNPCSIHNAGALNSQCSSRQDRIILSSTTFLIN